MSRLAALRKVLAERPEESLLLVSHWGVLHHLTGASLEPGELRTFSVSLGGEEGDAWPTCRL